MNMNQSFTIENGMAPVLRSNQAVLNCDVKFLKYYLGSFRNLFFEGYSEGKQAEKDSIHQLTPFCVIQVTKTNGEKIKLQVNLKAIDNSTMQHYDEQHHMLPYDKEKYFAFINDDVDMVIIQQYAFGKLFKTLDELLKIKS